jgi:transcriptional regulator with XRE-family HTH domain
MEIGKQIKSLRAHKSYSQDDLALKIFVSRQTISNWENDKNYPDIKSLLLISSLFDISLDQLIKGDVEKMKEKINSEEMRVFKKESSILATLFLLVILSFAPIVFYGNIIGYILWGVMVICMLFYAYRIEKHKKVYNIQTYKEIVNFMEGKPLVENQKQQEFGKRVYQKIILVVILTTISVVVSIGLLLLLEEIF